MRLIRTRLTWYAYLLSGFFTFIINIQGNIIPFLRDELRLSYAAVSLHPSALAAGMMATGLLTERVLAAIGRRWTCLLGVAGCIGGLLAVCVAGNAAASIGGCALVGLTGGMLPGIVGGLLADLHRGARDQVFTECRRRHLRLRHHREPCYRHCRHLRLRLARGAAVRRRRRPAVGGHFLPRRGAGGTPPHPAGERARARGKLGVSGHARARRGAGDDHAALEPCVSGAGGGPAAHGGGNGRGGVPCGDAARPLGGQRPGAARRAGDPVSGDAVPDRARVSSLFGAGSPLPSRCSACSSPGLPSRCFIRCR